MSGLPDGASAVAYSPSTQCNCWTATLRIVTLCSRGRGLSQGQTSPQVHIPSPSPSSRTGSQTPQKSMSTLSLSDALTMARNLIQHWETLNGCASAASHMNPQALCYMAESISWVLSDYEAVVEIISRGASETQLPPGQPVSMATPTSNDAPSPWGSERTAEDNIPRAFVGNLELDPVEAIIVAQEALSHSVARLIIMLQDIEEEASLRHQEPDGDYSLREKDLKGLATRLFRLLRQVNKLGPEPD